MKNFENIQVPQIPINPTHILSEQTPFILRETAPKTSAFVTDNFIGLTVPVIVLEECVGFEGTWAKIKVQDESGQFNLIGYILQKAVYTAIRPSDVKPSIIPNLSPDFLADDSKPEILWREQAANRPFNDDKRGLYCVLYDTGIERLEQKELLKEVMTDALYKGLELIFKNRGKSADPEYVKTTQDKYFLFGTAEAIDFSLRKCSTLLVLVTVPKKYLESFEIEDSKEETTEDPTAEEPAEDTGAETNEEEQQPESRYVTLFFNSYNDLGDDTNFENFFEDISDNFGGLPLGALNKGDIIFKNRDWYIEPNDVDIQLGTNATQIADLKNKLNLLVMKNIPLNLARESISGIGLAEFLNNTEKASEKISLANKQVTEFFRDIGTTSSDAGIASQVGVGIARGFAPITVVAGGLSSGVTGVGTELASGVTKRFGQFIGNFPIASELHWEGKLKIVIDYKDLKIVHLKYINPKGIAIPLNIEILEFLDDEICKSKTVVNFILQRHFSKLKRKYHIELRKQKILSDNKNLSSTDKDVIDRAEDDENLGASKDFDEITPLENNLKYSEVLRKKAINSFAIFADSFLIKEFRNEIEQLDTNTPPVDDEFFETLEVADFSALGESTWNLLKAPFVDEGADEVTGPHIGLSKFLLKYHYPKVTVATVKPLNISQCVQENYQAIKDLGDKGQFISDEYIDKIKKSIKDKEKDRKNDIDRQLEKEGDLIKQSLKDFPNNVTNKNLRLLLGVDKVPSNVKAYEALNQYIIPALNELDLNAILAEVLKCNSSALDPQEFNDLLRKYNRAKKLLEEFAANTVCNPFLSAALKKLSGLELPTLPVYNPNRNLVETLTNLIVELIQQILILSVRLLLTGSIKACLRDPNKEKNPSAIDSADEIADALANPETENDQALNDTLDDIFGIDSNNPNLTDEEKKRQRDAAKEKLRNFFDAVLCLLSSRELCNLLKGRGVEDEVFRVIQGVIRNKFPELAGAISTTRDIKNLFAKIGRVVNPEICVQLDDPNFAGRVIPTNPLCDDGTLQDARRRILDEKNIPEDVIDDILSDIKQQEAKNVEDILKFLDSDQPFDFSNVPSILCRKGPDGEIIKPEISLMPPIGSFSNVLNTLFKDIYTTFNNEALEWSKTTYSIRTKGPQLLKLNEQTGKLEPDLSGLVNPEEPDKNNASDKGDKELLPSYLFKDILDNKKYSGIVGESSSEFTFSSKADGNIQEKEDANLVNASLRQKVDQADQKLRLFLSDFLDALNVSVTIGAASSTIESINTASSPDVQGFFKTLEEILPNFTNALAIFDNFMRKNPAQMEDASYKNLLSTLGPNIEATAMLFDAQGVAVYIKIMEFLSSRQSEMNRVIDLINKNTPSSQVRLINNRQNLGEFLKNSLQDNINEYKSVLKIYSIVLKAGLNYPVFDLKFYDNYRPNAPVKFNDDLHDKYKLEIIKNNNIYINIENYQDIDKDVLGYATNNLKIDNLNADKEQIFKKFIETNNKDINFDSSRFYKEINSYIFDSCLKNIGTSDFFDKYLVTQEQKQRKDPEDSESEFVRIPPTYKAITDFIKLVIEPTPVQIQCNINPHYLDIDSLKNEAVENKKNSSCVDEILNQKIANNEPINAEELRNLETTDDQNIMLSPLYRLAIRVYAHDIILRGIATFGYYDPQFLRSDGLFIDFLSGLIETEMRSVDQLFYDMMSNFFAKQYENLASLEKNQIKKALERNEQYNRQFTTGQDITVDPTNKIVKRQIIKNIIRQELKTAILPKLSKRILDDTNFVLNQNAIPKKFDLNFVTNYEELEKQFSYVAEKISLFESNGSIYLRIFDRTEKVTVREATLLEDAVIQEQKLYIDYKIFNGTKLQFDDSKPEFRLLFDFIFPIKRYITTIFITNVLCTSTRKQILDAFKGTKKGIRTTAKIVQSNGQGVNINLSDPQSVINDDPNEDVFWFVLKTLLSIPVKIAKGFIEGADLNAGVSSTIYKIGRMFDENLTSFVVPAVGVPLGFLGLIPFSPFMPFAWNPFNIIYYAGLLWYEDNSSDSEKAQEQKRNYINGLFNTEANLSSCEAAKDHSDIIKLQPAPKDYYIKNT